MLVYVLDKGGAYQQVIQEDPLNFFSLTTYCKMRN